MIDSYFRHPFQRCLVTPIAKKLALLPIHPSIYTLFALIFGILAAFCIAWRGHIGLSLVLLFLSGYFDVLDGSIARRKNLNSPQGAIFDITIDRLVEFSIVFGLYYHDPTTRASLCLLLCGAILFCVTTFLVVAIFIEKSGNKSFYYHPGLMERSEAFIFFALLIAFPSAFPILTSLFIALLFVTGLWRLILARRLLSRPN